MLMGIGNVLEKNQWLLDLIKKPLLNEPYGLENFRLDLTLLESTTSLKYDYIEDIGLNFKIDESIYLLQTVAKFQEELYSAIYSNQDIKEFGNHTRDEFIESSRQLLINAISLAEEENKSVIDEIKKYLDKGGYEESNT